MDDENKFWLLVNLIAATAIVLVVFITTSYWDSYNENQ